MKKKVTIQKCNDPDNQGRMIPVAVMQDCLDDMREKIIPVMNLSTMEIVGGASNFSIEEMDDGRVLLKGEIESLPDKKIEKCWKNGGGVLFESFGDKKAYRGEDLFHHVLHYSMAGVASISFENSPIEGDEDIKSEEEKKEEEKSIREEKEKKDWNCEECSLHCKCDGCHFDKICVVKEGFGCCVRSNTMRVLGNFDGCEKFKKKVIKNAHKKEE